MIGWWGRGFVVLIGVMVLVACGLDTVETVQKPNVPKYREQLGTLSLQFEHDPDTFSGLNFQGYDLYYKVYGWDSAFGHLTNDVQALTTSNTVEKLKSLGYQRMNGALSSVSAVPLVTMSGNSPAKTLTVDFGSEPPKMVFSTSDTPISLFRTLTDKTNGLLSYTTFSSLQTFQNPLPSDYHSTITVQDQFLEVDIFVVAVALSTDLVTIISPPAPLGTIQQIAVTP